MILQRHCSCYYHANTKEELDTIMSLHEALEKERYENDTKLYNELKKRTGES